MGQATFYVTRQLVNFGQAIFALITSETERSPTFETTEVATTNVSLINFERDESLSNEIYSIAPAVSVGRRIHFVSRHVLNNGPVPFTLPTSEITEVPTTSVSINNCGHEVSPNNESYSIDVFNVGLPDSSDSRSEDNEQNVAQGTLQGQDEETIVSRVYTNLSGFYSFIRMPIVSVARRIFFVNRHIFNIFRVPFTSPTNVGLPDSSDNRSEENEQNIVQRSRQREDEETVLSRVHRNLSAFYPFIRALVVSVGQGAIFPIRHILNICLAPFTLLNNLFTAIVQYVFSLAQTGISALNQTIRRLLSPICIIGTVICVIFVIVIFTFIPFFIHYIVNH